MKNLITCLSAVLVAAASSLGATSAPKIIDIKVTGHGQPVIFIPGLTTPGAVWDDTVKHLQDKYECYVVTIAGFGPMPPVKTDHIIDDARDQIIAYAREHKLNKPAIVGHSFGGLLALAIAEKAPDLPGDLVIVDSLPFLGATFLPGVTNAEEAKKGAEAMRQQMTKGTPEQFANYLRQISIPGMVTKPEDIKRVIAMCEKSNPATAG